MRLRKFFHHWRRTQAPLNVLLYTSIFSILFFVSCNTGRTSPQSLESSQLITSSDYLSTLNAEIESVDTTLDDCLQYAADNCINVDDCDLQYELGLCWENSWGDWTEAFCAYQDNAVAFHEVCSSDSEVALCSDETEEAMVASDEDFNSNMACSLDCTCNSGSSLTGELADCLDACEETEADNGCVAYYDDLRATGMIGQAEYDQYLLDVCETILWEGWHYQLSEILVYTSVLFTDPTTLDLHYGNDSMGSAETAEVKAESQDNMVITGIVLNAYKNSRVALERYYEVTTLGMSTFIPDSNKINVECVKFSWLDLIGQTEKEMTFAYDANGKAKDGCTEEFDTEFKAQDGYIISGIGLDGEDCGIEMGLYQREILPQYDPVEGAFLGDTLLSYYMADGQDSAVNQAGNWCTESFNDDCSQAKDNETNLPDVDMSNMADTDIAVTGIAIAASNDGKRCAINIYAETKELFLIEPGEDFIYQAKTSKR